MSQIYLLELHELVMVGAPPGYEIDPISSYFTSDLSLGPGPDVTIAEAHRDRWVVNPTATTQNRIPCVADSWALRAAYAEKQAAIAEGTRLARFKASSRMTGHFRVRSVDLVKPDQTAMQYPGLYVYDSRYGTANEVSENP